MEEHNHPRKKRVKNQNARYMKYAGLAFQLFFSFAIVLFLGQKIDAWMENETAYITVLLIVITFVGTMYKIMKDLE
jgi:heme/copper-type cytochrome/quinol oxidase subunit 4